MGDRCRIVVGALVEHLHAKFPGAVVSVHNSPHETTALTYARMILANETVAGISTFSVYPALATFGTGYIRKPVKQEDPNHWINTFDTVVDSGDNSTQTIHPDSYALLQSAINNIVLYETPNVAPVKKIKQLWEKNPTGSLVVEWMMTGNPKLLKKIKKKKH